MKKRVLLFGLLLSIGVVPALAQNKTLGVGAATPNSNAALHVESPTGNQGFIMPRLTTAQRTASGFTSLLGVNDNGLMVYDRDLKTIYIWDGAMWKTTAQVAGGPKLAFPYKDSVATGTGTTDLFALKYNNPEPKRVVRIENLNATNGSSTLSVFNAGTGFGGYFQVNNPASGGTALTGTTNSNLGGPLAPVGVYGESTGTGSVGGAFRVQNPANTFPALYANTLGTGPAISAETATGFSAIVGRATGGASNGVSGISDSSDPGSYAVLGQNSGAGPAGVFGINNTGNTSHALDVTTNGEGAAGMFNQNNAGAWMPALNARTNGLGAALAATASSTSTNANAAELVVANPANPRHAVRGSTAGTGSAAVIEITNPSNTNAAIFSTTAGTGAAIQGQTSTGFTAIYGLREGASNGNAGVFAINNAANTYPSLQASTIGTGSAINATHTGSAGDAVYADHQGEAQASAGNFRISNASNNASALFGQTNASGGSGIGAMNTANGIALAVWGGGMKISVTDITAASITTRACAYRITSGGTTFSLSFGPTDGEVFMVYNETGAGITVAGVAIPNGEGKMLVVFPGGVIRGL